jgi:hypothetical protein
VWAIQAGDSTLREWIKALPLTVGLPIVIGAASVKPEDAASNIAAWLQVAGFEHIPNWLASPNIDNRVIFGSLVVSTVYAFLIWGVPAIRRQSVPIPVPTPQPEPTPSAKTIRHAFSETQSIKVAPPFLGGNMTLRLDNVATLGLHVPYSMQSAPLILDVVPMDLAVEHSPNVSVDGAQGYFHSGSANYVFDVQKNKRHDITVAGRTFIVTLQQVKKMDLPGVANPIEYVFGISEK